MANKLRYTEKFFSVQGEGRYSGVPSIFLRMFGCNFRCKNFNRQGKDYLSADTKYNPEVKEIINNLKQYKTLDDLPLVKTGCDSYAAVYPDFKNFAHKQSVDDLMTEMVELLPNKKWGDCHLVITGGEPLLGWQRAYIDLLSHPKATGLKELTFETNGTQYLTNEFSDYLIFDWLSFNGRDRNSLTFSVSPKLSCSGESRENAINPEVILDYQSIGFTYLKFVVGTETDVNEALEVIDIYRKAGFRGPVYLMPTGGTIETYNLTKGNISALALKHGLRFSDRLHISLFGNKWGT